METGLILLFKVSEKYKEIIKYTEILEVSICAFAYRLFLEDSLHATGLEVIKY